MKKLSVFIIIAFFIGCMSDKKNEIIGQWLMYKVIQDGKDVTLEHNPHNERYLTLKSDSTFESGGRPYGKNTGKYVFDDEDNTLFLDSDAGQEDDSQWKVTFHGDTMYWQGYGSEWAQDFELIHIKDNK
jgi:hypothetical protein